MPDLCVGLKSVSTRRHQRSQARRDEEINRAVDSSLAACQEHAHEATHFLLVSSVQYELARDRDTRDGGLERFQAIHKEIDGLIRIGRWEGLIDFVRGLDSPFDIGITDSLAEFEAQLRGYWARFNGFGVGIAFDMVWLSEPRIYYFLLWKD